MPQPIVMKKPAMPQLVNTRKAAEILGRSAATLKRWRAEGVGPNWIELQGRVSYDVNVLLGIHPEEHTSCFRAGCNGGSS